MQNKKREHPKEKSKLHPRNKHRDRYNFKQLISCCPDLAPFVHRNEFKDESINFANAEAVKMLNKALLLSFYKLNYWDIPQHYLCPPIPGRADYVHYIADLLSESNKGLVPIGNKINCLDTGTGANCIYPIIGCTEYGWSFVGSDIDAVALASASKIVENNTAIKGQIELRLQSNSNHIFKGIIGTDEKFDLTICNPPFHSSKKEADAVSLRKLRNLNLLNTQKAKLNFGGRSNELWCNGGEPGFVKGMISESKNYEKSCFWFTTLVSKQSNLKSIYYELNKVKAFDVRTITMGQGNKISRVVAWTFLDKTEQQNWVEKKNY